MGSPVQAQLCLQVMLSSGSLTQMRPLWSLGRAWASSAGPSGRYRRKHLPMGTPRQAQSCLQVMLSSGSLMQMRHLWSLGGIWASSACPVRQHQSLLRRYLLMGTPRQAQLCQQVMLGCCSLMQMRPLWSRGRTWVSSACPVLAHQLMQGAILQGMCVEPQVELSRTFLLCRRVANMSVLMPGQG